MKSLKNPPRTPERVPTRLRLFCEDGGGVRLAAALPLEGDKPPLRRFSMTAYTGGAMQLSGWRYPVVVDLAGLRVPKKSRPILKDHNPGQIVGHTDEIAVGDQSLEVKETELRVLWRAVGGRVHAPTVSKRRGQAGGRLARVRHAPLR